MNSHSYPGRSSKGIPASTHFAREVYRAEDAPDSRAEVLEEIASLRAEVRTEVRALRGAMNRPRTSSALDAEIAALRAAVEQLLAAPAPKKGDAYAALLRARGIEGAAATALTRGGKTKGITSGERLASAIATQVAVTPWPIACTERSIVALVGPAGVGKTTTAAKLGARAIRLKKTVAFVSCDTFRVGAIDQLRRYAELMESEFRAVTSPEELLSALQSITVDVIIVDTSGRTVEQGSVEATLGDEQLRGGSATNQRIEVMLCVPAALRSADAARIARDFACAVPTSLCVTKLDETDAPSALVHAPFATNLPTSTLCFGQRVPQDIASATHEEIVARLVPQKARDAQDA